MIALTPWVGPPEVEIFVNPADVRDILSIGDSGVTVVETPHWTHYVRESPSEVRRMVEDAMDSAAPPASARPVYREGLIADE